MPTAAPTTPSPQFTDEEKKAFQAAGRLGGLHTLEEHGRKHFRKIRKLVGTKKKVATKQ